MGQLSVRLVSGRVAPYVRFGLASPGSATAMEQTEEGMHLDIWLLAREVTLRLRAR